MFITPDYIFSDWIFFWWILFYLKFTKYNPKFILIISLIQNCFMFLYLFSQNTKKIVILSFFIIDLIIKIIPLILIINTKINKNDIYFTILLYLIYNIYLFIRNTNVIEITNKILYYQKHNIPKIPSLFLAKKFINIMNNILF